MLTEIEDAIKRGGAGGAGAWAWSSYQWGERQAIYDACVCVYVQSGAKMIDDEGNFWLVNETFSVLVSRRVWSFQ